MVVGYRRGGPARLYSYLIMPTVPHVQMKFVVWKYNT
jgi:hypothetical protein